MNLLLLLLPPHPLNLSERFREAKCQPHKGKKTLRDGADGPDGADEDGPGAATVLHKQCKGAPFCMCRGRGDEGQLQHHYNTLIGFL